MMPEAGLCQLQGILFVVDASVDLAMRGAGTGCSLIIIKEPLLLVAIEGDGDCRP
jgi:hypothetical protein